MAALKEFVLDYHGLNLKSVIVNEHDLMKIVHDQPLPRSVLLSADPPR